MGKISFADSVVKFRVGNPAPIEKYSDPNQCLHEPNYKSYRVGTFLSLGCEGSVTVAFTDNGFMNLEGDDLHIFEVGPSEEAAKVEISENGIDWHDAGRITGGKSSIDLSEENIDSTTVFHYVRLTDERTLCHSKSAGADVDAIAAINSVLRVSINTDVLFDIDEFSLKPTAQQTLEHLVGDIQRIDKATILVEGHTDSDGDVDYNFLLSKNRCLSVVDRIRSLLGLDAPYDFEVRPYGESKPKVENTTVANKQENRRVEITVLPPKAYFSSLLKKN
jgi:outer membrane protein OmpA-like peptidoglycan-associated protein